MKRWTLTGALLLAAGTASGQGAALYAQHCAACHQPDGSGTVGLAPALKGPHWGKLGAERAYLAHVLVHGLSGPIQVNGQPFVGVMPAFGGQLDDASLAALASHVRGLQGAPTDTPAYSADEIKAVRAQPGSPPVTRKLRVQLMATP